MKVLMLLGLVAATIYGVLVLSSDLLPREPAENAFGGRDLGNPSDRQLRSWGTDLPSLADSGSRPSLAFPEPSASAASSSPAPGSEPKLPSADSDSRLISTRTPGSEPKLPSARPGGTANPPIEWAKVALTAKVHGEASVSSPTLRLYKPNTALQVVSRQNDWVQIIDPTSGERGWVFEQDLVPADGPTTTQTAMATTTSTVAAELAQAPAPAAKKRITSRRPARMPDKFAVTQFDRRWERRAARRGGLFFFGRFARA